MASATALLSASEVYVPVTWLCERIPSWQYPGVPPESVRFDLEIDSALARFDDESADWKFVPYRGLSGGHVQTIAGALWRRSFPAIPAGSESRLVDMHDGTKVLIRCAWQADRTACPTALIVHGLEGSDASRYMLGTADKFLAAGWNAVRLNIRNCGDTEHLSPTLYHSGMTSDLTEVLRDLIEREELPAIGIVGFSLGGNVTLKTAGELGPKPPPELLGVAAVSPAIDLSASAVCLESRENWLYTRRFVNSLKRRMRTKDKHFPGQFDLSRLNGMRTVREYDDRFIAPLYGFRDSEDYYERASSRHVLPTIAVPTLLIHASDDPFVPMTDRVRQAAAENRLVRLIETARGGHVGWVAANSGRVPVAEDRHWVENRVVDFLRMLAEARFLSPNTNPTAAFVP